MTGGRAQRYRKRNRRAQLRAFCRAAGLGSFTRAADELLVEPPVVSLHVRELEHELGTALFERSGPNVALTEAGERFHELCRPLVEGMDALPRTFAEAMGRPAGTVRLAAGAGSAAYLLPRPVARFRDEHPEVGVRFVTGNHPGVLRFVREGEAELGMTVADPGTEDLDFRPCFSFEMVLVAPADHPFAGREAVSLQEAAAEPVVVPELDLYAGGFGQEVLRLVRDRHEVVIEASDWTILNRYVELGLGVGFIPSFCLGGRERVSVVRLRGPFGPYEYGLYARRGRPPSAAAEALARTIESGPFPARPAAAGAPAPVG